jgi:hypothetical protein
MPIDWFTKRIHHAPQPRFGGHNGGLRFGDINLAAKADTFQRRKGQQQSLAITETNNFAENMTLAAGHDIATSANGQMAFYSCHFNEQTLHARYAAINPCRGHRVNLGYDLVCVYDHGQEDSTTERRG